MVYGREIVLAINQVTVVRMFNEDVEELFDLIPRNTKVTITK